MKRSMFAFTALAGAAFTVPVAAQAPAAAPAPVAAPYVEPIAAPAPAAVPGNAPYAPVTDGLLQSNPAAQGSISSVLSIPHRWADKRVAVFQWSTGNSVMAYGTLDNYFAGFQTGGTRGDFTAGYTTPGWAAGAKINFGKKSVTTSDSIGGSWVTNQETDSTYTADGFELIGSYKMDPYHLYGAFVWRTLETSASWQTASTTPGERNTYSRRYDNIGIRLGARTYVTESEGLAWRVGVTMFERFLRPSATDTLATVNPGNVGVTVDDWDSTYEKTEVYDLGITGDVGYRFATAANSQFTVGLNSAFNTTNGKPDGFSSDLLDNSVTLRRAGNTLSTYDNVDYSWTLRTRPNVGLLLPIFERWTLLGGAGLDITYTSYDVVRGEDEMVTSSLMTTAPTGSVGLRYAKEIWAIQAQVSNDYLSNGPHFLSGAPTNSALASFGLTVNLK